ncbi:hypothetical protein LPJGGPFB_05115 [Ensifer adhaerens]|uniref:hypothetical protein n=1 Tax=Ensifer adhaerens TaxID=106592 RepID=UPI001568740E|nr:hypothetical protein [Ensifer adhaerens]NRP21856.1 hypothetical protein [Ensifer adhaerens]
MVSEKKGDYGVEADSGSLSEEDRGVAIDDTPDALLLLANRLQKALDARSTPAPIKKSRATEH